MEQVKHIPEVKEDIKPLPEKLRKNSFDYIQHKRSKKAFIYIQVVSENRVQYEVFERKIRPERTINGKVLPAKERFPNDEAFGYWAWSYMDYNRAIQKYEEISKSIKNEENE
jgi:hypothetical protein